MADFSRDPVFGYIDRDMSGGMGSSSRSDVLAQMLPRLLEGLSQEGAGQKYSGLPMTGGDAMADAAAYAGKNVFDKTNIIAKLNESRADRQVQRDANTTSRSNVLANLIMKQREFDQQLAQQAESARRWEAEQGLQQQRLGLQQQEFDLNKTKAEREGWSLEQVYDEQTGMPTKRWVNKYTQQTGAQVGGAEAPQLVESPNMMQQTPQGMMPVMRDKYGRVQPAPQQMPGMGGGMGGNMGGPQAPLSMRTNNPGAIKDGPFTQGQPGYAGAEKGFARFGSPEQGRAAQEALLSTYGQKGVNTVRAIVQRWAPQGPENSPQSMMNYVTMVAQHAGVSPDQPLDMNDPKIRGKIAEAMALFESGIIKRPEQGGIVSKWEIEQQEKARKENREDTIRGAKRSTPQDVLVNGKPALVSYDEQGQPYDVATGQPLPSNSNIQPLSRNQQSEREAAAALIQLEQAEKMMTSGGPGSDVPGKLETAIGVMGPQGSQGTELAQNAARDPQRQVARATRAGPQRGSP